MIVFGEPVFSLKPSVKKAERRGKGRKKKSRTIGGTHGRHGLNKAAIIAAQPSLSTGYGYNYGNSYGG